MAGLDLSQSPVIAAVKNEAQLARALESDIGVIFLLFGDILNVADLCARVSAAGKKAIVHLDLVNGLAGREIAVDFIAKTTCADGVISTKPALVRRAIELGLFAVLRVFVIDSMALSNLEREIELCRPDVVEILPGIMPEILRRVSTACPVPVVAGGLIASKKDILSALSAGAVAVSTTHEESWTL